MTLNYPRIDRSHRAPGATPLHIASPGERRQPRLAPRWFPGASGRHPACWSRTDREIRSNEGQQFWVASSQCLAAHYNSPRGDQPLSCTPRPRLCPALHLLWNWVSPDLGTAVRNHWYPNSHCHCIVWYGSRLTGPLIFSACLPREKCPAHHDDKQALFLLKRRPVGVGGIS
jgi:hypothetical protein